MYSLDPTSTFVPRGAVNRLCSCLAVSTVRRVQDEQATDLLHAVLAMAVLRPQHHLLRKFPRSASRGAQFSWYGSPWEGSHE